MAFKEPQFDRAGAKAFAKAWAECNEGQIRRKPTGTKKAPSKPAGGAKGKKK